MTTVAALQELATGVAPGAVDTSMRLFEWPGDTVDVVLTSSDTVEETRVIVVRDGFTADPVVPDGLQRHRREVIGRMASFAGRAQNQAPLTLPRAWRQYKFDNFMAFHASPHNDGSITRWIAEVRSGKPADVIFWEATNSDNKTSLSEFASRKRVSPRIDEDWASAVRAAESHFANLERAEPSDVEIALPELDRSAMKGWSYDTWMGVVSDDQRAFIEAPTDKAIRLRGPAGSGKTLALTLKAVNEALRARKSGKDIRILMVTHGWSLASEISDSKDALGLGPLPEIEVFPLLEIASAISPGAGMESSPYKLIGNDSFSGKQAQLDQILELLQDFIEGDWLTYRSRVSPSLRARFDSEEVDDRFALAWDLLVEFGSVIGAAAIFPGAGSESRYTSLERATWMLPLETRDDLRVVFDLYTRYMENLDAQGLWTSDQVLADLLNDLQKHSWNRARRTEGYDLIFVDEFHLFNPLERQVLHYLSRDVSNYPRIFMALDPRQSPSEAFIGLASDETHSTSAGEVSEGGMGDIANFELTTVHRYTPQILHLVKHVHHEFPTLDLGADWNVDFSAVESGQEDGPLPRLTIAASPSGEEDDIVKAVHDRYHAGTMALAIVDTRQWRRFSELAARINGSPKFHVATISGRTDDEGLGYRKRGLVVGLAEYLAGLQFDTVLVAGIPDMQIGSRSPSEQTRLLSLLYLALSRAESGVQVFVNDEDGGAPEVLQRAVVNGLIKSERGSLT